MSAKNLAIELRQKGYSYRYIADKTKLSISTLSYHLRDIPYQPNAYTVKTIGKARAKSGASKAEKKRLSIERALCQAVDDIGLVSPRDLFMLGIGLYIGEGSKTHSLVRLVNSDARVIRLFIRWLVSLGYPIDKLAIRIHLYPDSNITEAEKYWSNETGLGLLQFQKPCIDKRVNKDRKSSGTHKYGTAHVTVRSNGQKAFGVDFARLIGAWMDKVLN